MRTPCFASAVFELAVLLAACAPSTPPGYQVEQLRVSVPSDMAPEEVALVISSCAIQLHAFEGDFGRVPPTHVTAFSDPLRIDGGTDAGVNWFNGQIWVWRGPAKDTCWGLYHEFGHSVFGPGHALSVWPWIFARNAEIAAEIERAR